MTRATLACGLGLLLSLAVARAQDPSTDTSARFAKLLKKLASDEFSEREEASKEMAALPSEAVRLVEATLKEPGLDAEIRTRLESLLPRIKAKARREASDRKKASSLEWMRRSVLEPFEKSGRKDAPWNAKAREALEAIIPVWAELRTPDRSLAHRAYELSKEAVQAGCDDPAVLYAYARMYDVLIRKDYQEAVRLHLNAARAMKERGTQLNPLRQAYVYGRGAEFLAKSKKGLPDGDRKEAQEWLDLSVARYGDAAKDATTPDYLLLDCAEAVSGGWSALTKDRKIGFDKLAAALTQARPQSTLPLVLKGTIYTHYAWDARGGGLANTVTEEGWKLCAERLAEAEAALTQAWQKNPGDPQAPTQMLAVELGQAKGRAAMETWYARAMEADPDNFEACKKKMYYLEPKWHGSQEEMLQFGRQLLAAGNWEARLPFQLVDAHNTLSLYEKDRSSYYKMDGVWKDVKAVYETYLKDHSNANFDRTGFAKLACWCGQYTEANQQFKQLGDKAVLSVFANRAEMDALKAEAAAKGR